MLTIDGVQRYTPPPPRDTTPVAAEPLPTGDGTFSDSVAGTSPQPDLDLALARMSNDSYAANNPDTEQALAAAGWDRLEPNADGTALVDDQGRELPFDTSLLSSDNGLDSAVFRNGDGQYVLAFRGTDDWGTSGSADLDDNAGQGLGFDSPHYQDAILAARELELAVGDGNLVTTGHSLGGGLASAAALAIDSSAVTFNSAGIGNDTLERLGFAANATRDAVADSGQIRRYAVDGDPLTAAQEDVPLIPLLNVSPPDALGYALRVAPPAGLGFDLAALHGGGGDDASYVAALEQNTAYDPRVEGTQYERAGDAVDRGLDLAGDAGGRWFDQGGDALSSLLRTGADVSRLLPLPGGGLTGALLDGAAPVANGLADGAGWLVDNGLDLAGSVLSPVIGTGGNVAHDVLENIGEYNINQLGDTARSLIGIGTEAWENGSETVSTISDTVRDEFANGDWVAGGGEVVGALLDGGIETVGDTASGIVGWAGDTYQNAADAGGGLLRDLGDEFGISGITDPVAGFYEGAGGLVSDLADGAGGLIEAGSDVMGDAAEATAGFAGDVAQGASDFGGWVGSGFGLLK